MSELERLRQEVAARRRAVANKISRTRRTTGAEVGGSEFDPRRQVGIEKRYNKAQLNRYLADMNNFMSRNTQFANGGGGVPLKRGTAWELNRLNREVQAARERHAGRLNNLPAPLMGDVSPHEIGVTLGQSQQMLHPKADGGVKGPYAPLDMSTSAIASEKAARTLINDLRKQLSASHLPNKLQQGRDNLVRALEIIGENGLIDDVNRLSDEQFDALWFGSAFAEITFMKYDVEKARHDGTRKEKWQDRVVDNAFDDINRFLEWASQLDNGGTENGQTPKKR